MGATAQHTAVHVQQAVAAIARLAADPVAARTGARLQPPRGEPFASFQHFASQLLQPDLVLRLAVQLNRPYPGLRAGLVDWL